MQIKERIVIAHKEYSGSFINRMSNGLTTDLDSAMTFKDIGEASEFLLNNMYSPHDKECYFYKQIKITKEVLDGDDSESTSIARQ